MTLESSLNDEIIYGLGFMAKQRKPLLTLPWWDLTWNILCSFAPCAQGKAFLPASAQTTFILIPGMKGFCYKETLRKIAPHTHWSLKEWRQLIKNDKILAVIDGAAGQLFPLDGEIGTKNKISG